MAWVMFVVRAAFTASALLVDRGQAPVRGDPVPVQLQAGPMRGQQRVPGRDGGPVGQAGPATAPDAGSRGPDRPGCRESPAGRDPGDPGRGCPGLSRPPGGYKTAHREDPSGWRETEDNDVVVPRSAHRAGEFPRGSRGRSAALPGL